MIFLLVSACFLLTSRITARILDSACVNEEYFSADFQDMDTQVVTTKPVGKGVQGTAFPKVYNGKNLILKAMPKTLVEHELKAAENELKIYGLLEGAAGTPAFYFCIKTSNYYIFGLENMGSELVSFFGQTYKRNVQTPLAVKISEAPALSGELVPEVSLEVDTKENLSDGSSDSSAEETGNENNESFLSTEEIPMTYDFPVSERIRTAIIIAGILFDMLEHEVIHGDLHLGNVMYNPSKDPPVGLIDFGLSCRLNETIERINRALGSPDQPRQGLKNCSKTSSIWQFLILTANLVIFDKNIDIIQGMHDDCYYKSFNNECLKTIKAKIRTYLRPLNKALSDYLVSALNINEAHRPNNFARIIAKLETIRDEQTKKEQEILNTLSHSLITTTPAPLILLK